MTFLPIFMQWLHIGCVVLMIGGVFFLRFIVLPASKKLPDTQRIPFMEALNRRFRGVVWISLAAILLSGIYSFASFLRKAGRAVNSGAPQDYSMYIFVLGLKLLVVILIFTFALLLTVPYPVFAPIQKRPSPWLTVTLILAGIVIFLSAVLRN